MKNLLISLLFFCSGSLVFSSNSTEGRRLISGDSYSIREYFMNEMMRLKKASDLGDDSSTCAYEYLWSLVQQSRRPELTSLAKERLISNGLCDDNGNLLIYVVIAIEAKVEDESELIH